MSSRTLFRWAAAAVILSAISMSVGGMLHPAVDPASITTPRWALAHVLWWIGAVLGLIGLVGLYLRQRREVGTLGFVGAGMAWMGTAVLSGAMFFEGLVEPTVLARAPHVVATFPEGAAWRPFLSAVLASGVLLGLGFMLFGIAMYRAAILPRWAIVLAVVGGIAQGVSFLLPRPIASLGGLAFGLGLIGLGYGLWSSVQEADAPPALGARASVAEG